MALFAALTRAQGADKTLKAENIQAASTKTGQEGTVEEGQVVSLSSPENFINFCSGKTLTNGDQNEKGSCNGIPMGDLPGKNAMVSALILFPENAGEPITPGQPFDIKIQMENLVLGSFTNPINTYYSAPQQLQNGKIVGHVHVTVQSLGGSLNPTKPLDASQFEFFKGINVPGSNGLVTATVTNGLAAGFYRACTLAASANHQPVIMPVAQRGAQDDCVRFEVGGLGNNNKINNANQNQAANAKGAKEGEKNQAAAKEAQNDEKKQAAAKEAQNDEKKQAAAKEAQNDDKKQTAAKEAQNDDKKQAATKEAQNDEKKQAAAKEAQNDEKKQAAAKEAQNDEKKQAAAKEAQNDEKKQAAAKEAQNDEKKKAGAKEAQNDEKNQATAKTQGTKEGEEANKNQAGSKAQAAKEDEANKNQAGAKAQGDSKNQQNSEKGEEKEERSASANQKEDEDEDEDEDNQNGKQKAAEKDNDKRRKRFISSRIFVS
ncbi:hypothetical protein K3495_g13338 [Podosphaera aphanis]|nr:hypothetical protein K3495_g13338 [Podosphaera aphanis]